MKQQCKRRDTLTDEKAVLSTHMFRFRLGIPPEQGYGDQGTPDGRIPGGSTLFFKIQLLEVMSAGIGGGPTLLGADGQKLDKSSGTGGLLGVDGKPFTA